MTKIEQWQSIYCGICVHIQKQHIYRNKQISIVSIIEIIKLLSCKNQNIEQWFRFVYTKMSSKDDDDFTSRFYLFIQAQTSTSEQWEFVLFFRVLKYIHSMRFLFIVCGREKLSQHGNYLCSTLWLNKNSIVP